MLFSNAVVAVALVFAALLVVAFAAFVVAFDALLVFVFVALLVGPCDCWPCCWL